MIPSECDAYAPSVGTKGIKWGFCNFGVQPQLKAWIVGSEYGTVNIDNSPYSTPHSDFIEVDASQPAMNPALAGSPCGKVFCYRTQQNAPWEGELVCNATSAKGFFGSPEYQSRNTTNAQFVTQVYQCALFRTPAQSEVNAWTPWLEQGSPRTQVLTNFLNSPEFNSAIRPWLEALK